MISSYLASLTLIAFLLVGNPAHAKSLTGHEKMDSASETFMEQVVMGEVSAAMSLISAYAGVNLERFNQRAETIASDISKINSNAGQPLSYALLKKQAVDEHFYKLTYLLKYKAAALVWELNYYQADKGWHLVDVNFNANINALFE